LRRLRTEFDGQLSLTYVIGGMAGKLQKPGAFAAAWIEAGARYGQPVDPRALLEGDPPSSLVPAELAVIAVREQADPGPFLRRLREAIMLERAKADRGDALMALAREVADLDYSRLEIAFGSNGTVEDLGADIERAQGVALPSISVEGGEPLDDPGDWRGAVLAAGGEAQPLPSIEDALRRWGPMTTAEVAEVCDLPGPRAPAALWQLALEFRVAARRVPGGELWTSG
jgi:hypothetical protein